jgi:hypothetical protein
MLDVVLIGIVVLLTAATVLYAAACEVFMQTDSTRDHVV